MLDARDSERDEAREKVMRSKDNSKVREIVAILASYESIKGREFESTRERLDLLNRARVRLRRLFRMELWRARLDGFQSRLGILDSEWPFGSFDDTFDLRKFKHLGNQSERHAMALEIGEAVVNFAASIDNRLQNEEPLWPHYLVGLYYGYGGSPVQEFFEPAIPSNKLWPGSTEGGHLEFHARLACEVLVKIESERKRLVQKSLKHELEQLVPPLTWGEVLFAHISYLRDEGDTDSLKELSKLFPVQRCCLECDQMFLISKYNPGHFVCPRCSAKLRKRRERERKEGGERISTG